MEREIFRWPCLGMVLDTEKLEESVQSLAKQGTGSLLVASEELQYYSQLICTDFLADAFWSLPYLAAVH